MDATTGQKLSQARLAKNLSIEQVAHETRLRPDKILALEHDDYARFASNAYVKGFLQIYGRYLGVDVRAALGELESPSPVSISDYQYLNSAPAREPERLALRRRTGKPSLAPLIVFVVLCVLVGGGGYIFMNARRLGNLEQISAADPQPATPAPALVEKPAPAPPPQPEEPVATPEPETAPAAATDVAAADHEFIAQSEVPAPDVAPATINEVVIEPVRKTWVSVRTGDASSAPIFEDFLYTNAPPLKLRGAHFLIEISEAGAVNIRKNGAPIAYQGSGITIQ